MNESTAHTGEGGSAGDEGPVHPMQSLLDNPFLILFIGVAVPAALYLIWGIMEVTQIPIAQ